MSPLFKVKLPASLKRPGFKAVPAHAEGQREELEASAFFSYTMKP